MRPDPAAVLLSDSLRHAGFLSELTHSIKYDSLLTEAAAWTHGTIPTQAHVECSVGLFCGGLSREKRPRKQLICSSRVLGAQALAGFKNKIYSFNKTDKVLLTFMC